jgi:hypothetical protein
MAGRRELNAASSCGADRGNLATLLRAAHEAGSSSDILRALIECRV